MCVCVCVCVWSAEYENESIVVHTLEIGPLRKGLSNESALQHVQHVLMIHGRLRTETLRAVHERLRLIHEVFMREMKEEEE